MQRHRLPGGFAPDGGSRFVSCLLAALVALILVTVPASAQRSSEFTLDLRPFGGSVGVAVRIAPGVYLGASAGGGIDALDRTLAPDPADQAYHGFEQLAHVSAFLRQKPTARIDVDLGIRLGIGGVRSCDVSDCWPGAFAGLHAGVFWGTDRFKIGPRILGGLARQRGQSDPVLYAELITVRIRL